MQAFTARLFSPFRVQSQRLLGLAPLSRVGKSSSLLRCPQSQINGLSFRSFSRTAAFQLSNESVDNFFLTQPPRPLSAPSHSLLYDSIPDFYDAPPVPNLNEPSFPKTPSSLDQLTDMSRPPVFLQSPIVSVFTAQHRAAGTAATPRLRVVGEHGELEFTLNGDFSRGSCSLFSTSLEELGEIESVVVSTEDDDSFLPSNRWLLEKIVLSVPNRGDVEFVCNEWIGSCTGHESDDLVHEMMVLFPASEVSEEYEWDNGDELRLSLGRAGVPSADKLYQGSKSVVRKSNGHAGEDAYFLSYGTRRERAKEKRDIDLSMPTHYYLGVADGVGMWRQEGVNSALYSQHLLHSAREVIGTYDNPDAYKVLCEAWENATIVHHVKGSCTVCLIRVSPDGWVDGVQVGDSGLRLVRDGKVVYRSSEQEHLFGFPYQLGHISSTTPRDCLHHRFRVRPGDVMVLGSDGLFDNVSDRAMGSAVGEFCDSETARSSKKTFNGDELSRKLVTMAYQNSIQKEHDTPWSRAAQKEWDVPISGGKEDDVVAVVARVSCC